MMRITLFICVVLVCILFQPITSYAQVPREVPEPPSLPDNFDLSPLGRIPDPFARHDRVRENVELGKYISLSVIRKKIKEEYPGRIVDVRVLIAQREGLKDLYDVKVLTEEGQLLSIKLDAETAEIVDVKR